MTDMTAFESLIAEDVRSEVGPEETIDALAIARKARLDGTRWRFPSMISALKFVVAGAIVALFGGFLLAGALTTPPGDEMAPAAGTESPSPMTSEELLSGMVTDEVEPGVYRVVNDGVRDLSYPPGPRGLTGFIVDVTADGSVWFSSNGGRQSQYHLGSEPEFEAIAGFPYYREVAPDGSLWAIGEVADERRGIYTFDGEGWTLRATATDELLALAIGPDGTVWVAADDADKLCPDVEADECWGTALFRLEGDGSLTAIEDWTGAYGGDVDASQLAVSPIGDVWLVGNQHGGSQWADTLLRFDGEGWDAIPGPERWNPGGRGQNRYLDFGPDGALWVKANASGGLARFDDLGWTAFTEADGVEPWGKPWGDPTGFTGGLLDVSADGSLWLLGSESGEACGGVAHYHGTKWTSYLAGHCVHHFAIAPDASVWLGANAYNGATGIASPVGLYVITPDAVAGAE